MKAPFIKALPILKKIEDAGYEAYFVGGSVRDHLLDRQIDDVDIATSATPEEIQAIFPKTIDVGIAHGTVVVLYEGDTYEVTTFRSESDYDDFRRPNEVTFIRSLEEDLQRRDFTMNAIAMDKEGKIIDPFNGQIAIQAKLIQTVGNAGERFHEDALRMMRAIRFVSQLSFSLELETYQALSEHKQWLERIAVERKTTEFEKLLRGENNQQALKILIDTGIYQYLPGFDGKEKELMKYSMFNLSSHFTISERWVFLLFHLKLVPSEVEVFLRCWKLPVKQIRRVKTGLSWLYRRLEHGWEREDLYRAGEELVISTEQLFNVLKTKVIEENIEMLKAMLEQLPIRERAELVVTGQDLLQWYQIKGGPWIEEKLLAIEKAVVKREIANDMESIKEWLFRCSQP
ncbi:CCA tRNA nucleotidyltransferase [Robertmurraya massiliosenegalensis]|uniref:CCA tRNA nucleotidyltransferase n=1 Tax=Robertmurraya massiliosenegalensis TaxID=1287657 RepID=UPI0002EB14EC|nr:CCA tRNA nucleotidyltransferase [Robertmurraya massiliosenegalensis]